MSRRDERHFALTEMFEGEVKRVRREFADRTGKPLEIKEAADLIAFRSKCLELDWDEQVEFLKKRNGLHK